jgi:hypothetical protein
MRRVERQGRYQAGTRQAGGRMNRRLERLEVTLTATPADRGSYCRDCGGVAGEEAILALHTLDSNGTLMSVDDANATFDTLAGGHATCRRCGEQTLAGTLLGMLAADEQK